MFLILKLFNIIKFELKIYTFILNNIIKIFYIFFFTGLCLVGLIRLGSAESSPTQGMRFINELWFRRSHHNRPSGRSVDQRSECDLCFIQRKQAN
jgi:hypothetical protein